jgi:hypothetical protein
MEEALEQKKLLLEHAPRTPRHPKVVFPRKVAC